MRGEFSKVEQSQVDALDMVCILSSCQPIVRTRSEQDAKTLLLVRLVMLLSCVEWNESLLQSPRMVLRINDCYKLGPCDNE